MGRVGRKISFVVAIVAMGFSLSGQDTDTSFFRKPLVIKRLSDCINTTLDEYWPAITADEATFFFTRKSEGIYEQEDFYVSVKKNGVWQLALPLTSINTHENEGAQSISADGKFFVFTACDRKDGFGSCDLYYTLKVGDDWSKPVNMGKNINTRFWETQPSLSADGKTMYFVSNRPNGKGQMDIWKTNFLGVDLYGNILWTTPTNLNINTSNNELSPFIHHNGTDLYFSSDGYESYGGMDLFISKKNENDSFSLPQNLGKQINSPADEMGFVVSISGEKAYFASSSDRQDKDIFYLQIPKLIRPKPPSYYVKGKVVNKSTNEPIFAQLSLMNKKNKRDIQQYNSDLKDGSYLFCVNAGNEYVLYVSAEGYMYYASSISASDTLKNIDAQTIYLTPIAAGEKVILKHLYFDFDSYALKPASYLELDNMLHFLRSNPTLKILIAGHTDSYGTARYNLKLSTRRARQVYDYFVGHGINSKRLSFKGFGFSQPIDNRHTQEARAKNRRTEIIVVD